MGELPQPMRPIGELIEQGPGIARLLPAWLPGSQARYQVEWAQHLDAVREAQRLRYEVFGLELGARLSASLPGLDADALDDFCDHLLVRECSGGAVVGTYRVLSPQAAQRFGRLYADAEFDLQPLDDLRPHMLELGRSCVHREHRGGAVVLALWSALSAYAGRHGIRTVLGCTSVSVRDGGVEASRLHAALSDSHRVEPALRVRPRHPLALLPASGGADALRLAPPLLRGYLRFGARICGAPAHDEQFQVADFLTLLRTHEISGRYAGFVERRRA
jgi:putative hemolysin